MRSLLAVLLLVIVSLSGCGQPESPDQDADGLSDQEEQDGWMVTVVDASGEERTYPVNSDPQEADTDGDGVLDVHERILGLDPREADTDADGLSDCQEVQHTVRSECEDLDWEGTTDGGHRTRGDRADTDEDGLLDGEEVNGFEVTLPGGRTRTVTTEPLRRDSDRDILDDGDEVRFGTDPTVEDTDGDGCQDGLDPVPTVRERFQVGLESFTWTEPDAGTETRVRFAVLLVADSLLPSPGGQEGLAVRHGEPIEDLETPSVRAAQCSFTPGHPWVPIDIVVDRIEGENTPKRLDIHSHTNPGSAVRLWWNVQEDVFSWTDDEEETFEGPLVWEGAHGRLVLDPSLLNQGP